jgi:hypothetical protein
MAHVSPKIGDRVRHRGTFAVGVVVEPEDVHIAATDTTATVRWEEGDPAQTATVPVHMLLPL